MYACAERNQSVGRLASMAMEGSRGVVGQEGIALIAVWGDSLLRTKPTHSRRPRSLSLHYEAEKKIKRQHELFLAT